jgi:hypothetical protein
MNRDPPTRTVKNNRTGKTKTMTSAVSGDWDDIPPVPADPADKRNERNSRSISKAAARTA